MLDENNRLIFIAAIFAMSMLALVPVADAIELFPDAEAKEKAKADKEIKDKSQEVYLRRAY